MRHRVHQALLVSAGATVAHAAPAPTPAPNAGLITFEGDPFGTYAAGDVTGVTPTKFLGNVRDLDWSNHGTRIAYSRNGDST